MWLICLFFQESGEPKRKVVKRSKLEKDRELFELAQQYHKVVAERDAGMFVMWLIHGWIFTSET